MILKLDHHDPKIAKEIRAVWQISYPVEAAILGVADTDFPPLQRSLESFMQSENIFFGIRKFGTLSAVTEILQEPSSIHIQSMVVDPKCFRQGLAQMLITHVFNHYNTKLFTVETGFTNEPAIRLYQKNGFEITGTLYTLSGIKKVRMVRRLSHEVSG